MIQLNLFSSRRKFYFGQERPEAQEEEIDSHFDWVREREKREKREREREKRKR